MDFTPTSMIPDLPALHFLPQARSRFPLPDSHDLALGTFGAAQKDFVDGKYASAAKVFLSVASLLAPPNPETTYSGQYAQMRMVAYKNAAISFRVANDSTARAALTQALKNDPANQEGLQALLAKL